MVTVFIYFLHSVSLVCLLSTFHLWKGLDIDWNIFILLVEHLAMFLNHCGHFQFYIVETLKKNMRYSYILWSIFIRL